MDFLEVMVASELDASQAEARLAWVRAFRNALPDANRYIISEIASGIVVASKKCAFLFSFERRSAGRYTLLLSEPSRLGDGMAFFVLRQMAGARGSVGTPEALASLVKEYFVPLLSGDFSIRKQYRRLESRILDGMLKAERLPPDHPTRAKIRECDPTWLCEI